MKLKGIDVSKHNGKIDFDKVKKAGYDFVIIRAGYGKTISQKDPYFESNYYNAKRAGLLVGAYWYSYAKTIHDAKLEALTCIEAIKNKSFELPIFFDVEEKYQINEGTTFLGDLITEFCSTLENNDYFTGLYMSAAYLKIVPMKVLVKYTIWVAQWNDVCTYNLTRYGIWQCTSKGAIEGIRGDVDIDFMLIDYPTIIKNARLNGYNDIFNISLMEQSITNQESLDILYECRDKLRELKSKYM